MEDTHRIPTERVDRVSKLYNVLGKKALGGLIRHLDIGMLEEDGRPGRDRRSVIVGQAIVPAVGSAKKRQKS